jgi:naphtho-gamma-pyrone polyketide synthase
LPNHYHSYYGDGGQIYPVASDSHVIGLCVGLLASAAVTSSRTVGELIPVAINSVGKIDRQSQSWSAVISGLREEVAEAFIREFSKQKVGRTFHPRKTFESY